MGNNYATQQLVGTLKNFYAPTISSQFNDAVKLLKEMEKGKEKWNGYQVNKPVKLRRNPGIGATSDGGNLPTIGAQTTQQAIILAKFLYLRAGFTGPLLKASQGDKGSYIDYLTFELEEGMKDLKTDVNRQLWFDGSGTIATVSANAVNTNSLTVTGRSTNEPALKYLDVGVVIDIYSSAGVQMASSVSVVSTTGSPSAASATIVLSANVTTNSTDVIVRSGAYNAEIQGLLTSLDGNTTSIYSIDRSVYQAFQGNVIDCSAGQLTLNFIQQGFNEALRRGGEYLSFIGSDFDTQRFYQKLLIADKRYVGRDAVGNGSFSSKEDGRYLEFGGIPWIPDKDAPVTIVGLRMADWKKYVLSDMEVAEETGSALIADLDRDRFEMRIRLFMNLWCDRPPNQFRIKNYISP